ncbi:MAG: hypothetical protein IKM28_03085 [Lachnospiraceae bacterium]|nr:hypothetical protein [Lachnospiraceae bacterium]
MERQATYWLNGCVLSIPHQGERGKGKRTGGYDKRKIKKTEKVEITDLIAVYYIQEIKKINQGKGKTMMNTPYDDVFRTLLLDCRNLLIPVINELFQESYTEQDRIVLKENELFLKTEEGGEEKRITDSSFWLVRKEEVQHYHLECQSTPDGTMLIRLYEYDSQIALKEGHYEKGVLKVKFPRSAVLFLRHTKYTPDQMVLEIETPGGKMSYAIPTLKAQTYDIETIFEKRLFFLLPFHIFVYEKQLPQMEKDPEKREKLKQLYIGIVSRLNTLSQRGILDEYTKKTICQMAQKVLDSLAANYETTRKEVGEVMGGNILEYEAKTILMRGWKEGLEQGREQGREEGLEQGREEGLEQGQLLLLKQLIEKGILTLQQAAASIEKTEEELAEKLHDLSRK